MDICSNYIFVCLKRKHNSLDCHNVFLKYFPLIAKFTCSRLDTNQNCFCMFKAFKPWKWIIFFFLNIFFFILNVHHSFWKLKRILILMIRRAKGFELMKIVFITIWTHLVQSVFDFENYGFWKCGFNKTCSYLWDIGHECIIYMT